MIKSTCYIHYTMLYYIIFSGIKQINIINVQINQIIPVFDYSNNLLNVLLFEQDLKAINVLHLYFNLI